MPKGAVALIAFVAGALASAVVLLIAGLYEKPPVEFKDAVDVVVATKSAPAGTVLTKKLVRVVKYPEKCQTRLNVRPKEIEQLMGRRVALPLEKGRPITLLHLQRLAPPAAPGLPPGAVPLPR